MGRADSLRWEKVWSPSVARVLMTYVDIITQSFLDAWNMGMASDWNPRT